MIEQLIEAERLLSVGLIDQAERLYRGVAERDPASSIAVVGLARVALERGDDRTAYLEANRALAIDPENPAAQHLAMRLAEVMERRGEALPVVEHAANPDARPTAAGAASAEPAAAPAEPAAKPSRRGLVDRLLGRGE